MNAKTRDIIEAIYSRYHKPEYLGLDPIEYVRKFRDPADIEIAGFLASSLAYGMVETIRANVRAVFAITGKNIRDFTRTTSFARKQKYFQGFKHRFNDGYDISLFFEGIRRALEAHGSLQNLFVDVARQLTKNITVQASPFSTGKVPCPSPTKWGELGMPVEKGEAWTAQYSHTRYSPGSCAIAAPLNEFVKRLRGWANQDSRTKSKSFDHLLPLPSRGSACKRLHMFLRWMARVDDGIDLGIWTSVNPASLLMPVDTHIAQIARNLRLTARGTADRRMAEEITRQLKKISPADPVKYDFSLCRAGMEDFRSAKRK